MTSPAPRTPAIQRWLSFFCQSGIFLGSFLFFLVQPAIGKAVTPCFGGVAATWSVVMLFFQLILLGGYFFGYALSKINARQQLQVYIALAVICAVFSKVQPQFGIPASSTVNPQFFLLKQLLTHLTLPCLFLCTISTTLQNWWGRYTNSQPYWLYALSNTGSLLALLSYPVLIEPRMGLNQTFYWWRIAFVGVAALCAACAVCAMLIPHKESPSEKLKVETPPVASSVFSEPWKLWIVLPALTCTLLLSFTEELCTNLAPVPLLWTLPLAVYLLSYILAFSDKWNYNKTALFWVTLFSVALFLYLRFADFELITTVSITLGGLFMLCLWGHVHLYSTKPRLEHLPAFYLCLAVGGVLGGLFVCLLAPLVFDDFSELRWSIGGILLLIGFKDKIYQRLFDGELKWQEKLVAVLSALVAFYCIFGAEDGKDKERTLFKTRNFYGTLRVAESATKDGFILYHGKTIHGQQLKDPADSHLPTTYYHPFTGIGLAVTEKQKQGPLKIGVIGLGTGTISAYGRPGDEFVFFEINPQVVEIAKDPFHYLKDCPARIEVLLGDARITMESSPPQNFDILLLDAFNGDSVPVHLLTQEAMEVYLRHLKPNGIIAFHSSNRFLRLYSVVAGLAKRNQLNGYLVYSPEYKLFLGTEFILLSRMPFQLGNAPAKIKIGPITMFPALPAWTDDSSSIFSAIRWQ